MLSASKKTTKSSGNQTNLISPLYMDQSTQTESEVGALQLSRPDFKFQFHGLDNNLNCTIFSPELSDLPTGLVNSIVNYFKVRELIDNVTVDYTQTIVKKLSIKFNMKVEDKVQHKKMLKCVIELIEHLKTLQLQEVHENINALWFYAANGGEEILNFSHYPHGINAFLNEERLQVGAILSRVGDTYTTLVEVGCGAMENLALATNNNLKYLGVDFTAPRIIEAKKRIQASGLKGAEVKHLDIVNFNESDLAHLATERSVFLFPFNLLGNIAPIVKFMARLNYFGHDMLLSIYKTDDETNAIRLNYYENCGYTNIKMTQNDHGVVFRSEEGLYTIAYDIDYIVKLLTTIGFSVHTFDSNKHGIVLHAVSSLKPELTLKKDHVKDSFEQINGLTCLPGGGLFKKQPVSPTALFEEDRGRRNTIYHS